MNPDPLTNLTQAQAATKQVVDMLPLLTAIVLGWLFMELVHHNDHDDPDGFA